MQKIISLTPPTISADHIKEQIVCIRGHRERIFRVDFEKVNDKFIFHNYGQGGAGWTFLFGCVNESIRQFEHQVKHNPTLSIKAIAVLGAGCYGLLTAIILARKGYSVRIIAKDTDDIASYKAAGFFFPRPRKTSTPYEREIFESLGMESYTVYQQIINGRHPFIKTGAKLLPAYFGIDIDPGFTPYITQGLVAIPQQVMLDFGTNKNYAALEYKTIFINALLLMKELQEQRAQLGIAITLATIDDFAAIVEPIIFNCTNLGAQKLTQDKRLVAVQGHLITLKNQPSSEQLQYMINVKVTMINKLGNPVDKLIYYAPKESGILGITFMRGVDSLTENQHEFDLLLQRSKDYFGV